MAIDDPNISDLIEAHIGSRLDNLWTQVVGRVERYNASTQKADIQIVQRQPDPEVEEGRRLPLLGNVPVMWPRNSNMSITFPLAPGDTVVVWMLVYSIDNWIRDGVADRQPKRKGRFQLSSAVCFPSVSPDSDLLTSDATDPNALVIRAPSIIARETAGGEDFVALAQEVIDRFGELKTWLEGPLNAALLAAGGAAIPPSPAEWTPTVPSVATSKFKAE